MDYLSKKIEREKTQSTFMNNLQDRASLLAAIEAKRSRKLFRELIIHLLFFILLIVILFLQRDVQACHDIQTGVSISLFTNQIEHDLQPFSKTYTDVGQWEEYRDYLVGLFAPALTATEDYASNNLTGEELYNVEYVNKVVGAVRFRQLRVRNDSCEVAGPFRSVVTSCYAVRYNKETRDEEPFGPAHNTSKYTFTEDSGGVSYYAHTNLGFWDQSGYVVDIPVDENFSEAINELIADDFFGAATRAIIIQVNLLSVNYDNRVTNLLLLSEFSAAGLVSPFYSFRTFRIYMYSDALDSFRAFLEITFVIFLIYYIYASIRQWVVDYKVGRVKEYITDLWNITEVANLVLFFIATVMYLKYLGSDREGIDLSDRSDYVVEMEHFASDAIQFYQIAAINILLSAFKTFKYLKLNPRLYVLWETLYGARVDMATYMIMFLIILLGFLFFGWLTFGSDLEAFNGFSSSLGTLWQFLIGNPPEYDDLASANRVLGPLYYALFTIFVFFILVNMFVAIVSNSYETISAKVSTNSTLKVTDLKKPIQRLVKLAKVVASRKPLYSETELLTMLKNRQLLEKNVLTKQELEAELRAMGHDPLSLYIERLLSIHQKRKKFLAELIVEEKERRIEALQEAQEADAGVVSEGGVSVQMEGPVDNAEDEPQDENITQLEQLEKEMARNQANRNDATNTRLDAMEAKMDALMQKLDLLLLANNAPIQMAGRSRSNTSSQRPPGFDRDRLNQ